MGGGNDQAADVAARVVDTSLAIGAGRGKQRVRLAELRTRLADVDRTAVDEALVELERKKRLVLYRIDDPMDIGPEDEKAALFVAGFPRHILYLEQ
jgi:hypothetical protein